MNPKNSSSEITRLLKAFGYSWHGLKAAMAQPAFCVEVIGCIFLMPLALLLTVDAVERALLIGSLMLVLVVEILNSAIETTIDRISTEHHELSGRAKDMGSGAVLLSLMNAALVWALIIL